MLQALPQMRKFRSGVFFFVISFYFFYSISHFFFPLNCEDVEETGCKGAACFLLMWIDRQRVRDIHKDFCLHVVRRCCITAVYRGNVASMKVSCRSPHFKESSGRVVQGGHFCTSGMSLLSVGGCTAVPSWGWHCGLALPGVWDGDEMWLGFALGLGSLNCSRCFAAARRFVVKMQLVILIRLSSQIHLQYFPPALHCVISNIWCLH